MNPRLLPLGVLAVLSATSVAAYAGTITLYDSYTGNTGIKHNGASDTPPIATLIAQEFVGQNVTLSSVQLELSAKNPSDKGSLTVYLVPDSPGFESGPNLSAATSLGTILDKNLAATTSGAPALTTVTPSSSVNLLAGEDYWILVDDTTGSSTGDWWVGSAQTPAVGSSSLLGANNGGGSWGPFNAIRDYNTGQYGAIITGVPEPGTIGLLGAGLAGLGLARRRRAV